MSVEILCSTRPVRFRIERRVKRRIFDYFASRSDKTLVLNKPTDAPTSYSCRFTRNARVFVGINYEIATVRYGATYRHRSSTRPPSRPPGGRRVNVCRFTRPIPNFCCPFRFHLPADDNTDRRRRRPAHTRRHYFGQPNVKRR